MTDEAKRCVEALRYCGDPDNKHRVWPEHVCELGCEYSNGDGTCMYERMILHAADLIESLSAELEQVKAERDGLNVLLGQAQSMLEARTRERDAAVAQLREMDCATCANCDLMHLSSICHQCKNASHWQWRGVQEE